NGIVGTAGADGAVGPAGNAATYVGSDTCAACHADQAALFEKSGHGYKLNKVVDGVAPTYPFTEITALPVVDGVQLTWDDISYVIGGYNWKARFIDLDGYIYTGIAGDTTQYNFANPVVGNDIGFVAYHAGEQKPYSCGPCHTTGYNPDGHQDDLPGMVGTWAEDGIGCEECHGPGSNHAASPYGVALKIDRDSEACGDCHLRGSDTAIDAKGGFIKHHEQYEEIFQSGHLALDCVDCHDPHAGVIQGRQPESTVATVNVSCENCHFNEAENQASDAMKAEVECIDCHMPRIVKSAVGDAAAYTGDIRTHLFAINPAATSQFTDDGKYAISQIGLDFGCKSCHRTDGESFEISDAGLVAEATGYHE
ncbi:MAG: hypothetical protein HN837_04985, partial [Chloroflexi bacterium]|nr:hypothetical protein [Chloroflexota bacterium]